MVSLRSVATLQFAVLLVFLLIVALDDVSAQKWRVIDKGRNTKTKTGSLTRSVSRPLTPWWKQKKTGGGTTRRPKKWKPRTKRPPATVRPTAAAVDEFNARIRLHNGRTKLKNQFVPPDILDKFRRVGSLSDFVREFRPKGVTIGRKAPVESASFSGIASDGGLGSSASQAEVEVLQFDSASALRSSAESNEVRQPSSDAIIPRCQLKEFLRELPPEDGFHGILFPSCVKVNRCSGCCINTYFMECAPTRVEVTPQIAFKISFSGPHDTAPVKVNVTHHLACACQCKVKATDCLPAQTFSASNCQCECGLNPKPCPPLKAWHPVQCACKCVNPRECKSRRRYWDERTCSCACRDAPCPFGQLRNQRTCNCEESASSRFIPSRLTDSRMRFDSDDPSDEGEF